MANFMNPYEFIQPLLTSPVQNINAGIQAGANLAQLGNQFVKMREETKKLRAANEAYNALMSPGATTLDEPLTVDKMVQLHAAGVPLEPIIKLQAQAKKDIAKLEASGEGYRTGVSNSGLADEAAALLEAGTPTGAFAGPRMALGKATGGALGALYSGYSWKLLGPAFTFGMASIAALAAAVIIATRLQEDRP